MTESLMTEALATDSRRPECRCELSLELAYLLGAGSQRDRHLSRHAVVGAGPDHRDRPLCLDSGAGVRGDRRRAEDAAVDGGVVVRLRLCRVLPQHAAPGAVVSVVFCVAGAAAAVV